MAQRSTFFAHRGLLPFLERPKKRGPIYVANRDFWRCGSRYACGSEKGACIRPAGASSVGGYYIARTQRVDLLD